MPLASYGILKGGLFTPQEQTYQGDWFHGIFYLVVPNAPVPRRCVTDFSSATKDLIEYKIYNNLESDLFSNISALPDGYSPLAPTDDSGALDYVRSPIFGASPSEGWVVSDGEVAVQALQRSLSAAPLKLYVFGEPFTDASAVTQDGVQSKDGLHNVHMNQGDPRDSSDGVDHQADDGIWQDGATAFENADGTLTAFCSKFVSQTFATDNQGLPA
jgi:Uncharacterized conserved protein (DUF2278)